MMTFFITRFSILDHSYHGYQMTRNNDNTTYENLLFNEDRLDFKFKVFKNITLKSVLNQNNSNWEWHIYYSNKLNKKRVDELFLLTENHKKIKLFEVENFKQFFKKVKSFNYSEKYATVRLDDDDALSPNYTSSLNYYSKQKGKIISFPYGNEYSFINNRIEVGLTCRKPNIALGLAAIEKDIYGCGDHDYIGMNNDVIYDLNSRMYMICCSPLTDTKRERSIKKKFLLKTYINSLISLYGYHIVKNNVHRNNSFNQEIIISNIGFLKIINVVFYILGYQLLKLNKN